MVWRFAGLFGHPSFLCPVCPAAKAWRESFLILRRNKDRETESDGPRRDHGEGPMSVYILDHDRASTGKLLGERCLHETVEFAVEHVARRA
jgi:hypothetical protein